MLLQTVSKRGLSLALGGAVLAVAAQPMRPMVVVGNSMAPTYASGAVLWTTPIDRPLQRGDVVVVQTTSGPIVKRVALLPGDRRYQWHSAQGWTDLTMVALPRTTRNNRRLRALPVPAGTVFLLGDNLTVSTDSRSFGPVDEADVLRFVIDQRDPDAHAGVSAQKPGEWIALGTTRRSHRG